MSASYGVSKTMSAGYTEANLNDAPGRHGGSVRNVGIESAEHLVEHLAEFVEEPLAIVCVGNDLRGDDGAGMAIARELAGTVPWSVFETQTVPESFLMKIVQGEPASVILIDALDFRSPPGTIDLVTADKVANQGPSTHGPAPLAFLDVLQMMHPCHCAVLGIQARNVAFGQPLSQPVKIAVKRIVRAFQTLADRS